MKTLQRGSEQHAVLKSYVLWANLAQTGDSKESYPLFDELVMHELDQCALCTYARFIPTHGNCLNCPMYNRWPSAKLNTLFPICYSVGATTQSAYITWGNSDTSAAKLYAGKIATALWKLYKEIEIK
jgi:hypothetical protein